MPGMVAHTFKTSNTYEAEADNSLSSRSAWSVEFVPEQTELHRELL